MIFATKSTTKSISFYIKIYNLGFFFYYVLNIIKQ